MDNEVDNEIVEYLWVVNEALIKALKTAALVLEKVDEISPEKRQGTIDSLRELISQTEKAYEKEPAKY